MASRGQSKKHRRQRAARDKKRGVITGMRSGFKSVASSVTGTAPARKNRTSTWLSAAVTLLLIAAVAALLFYR